MRYRNLRSYLFLTICFFGVVFSTPSSAKCGELCSVQFWSGASSIEVKSRILKSDALLQSDNYGYTPLHYAAAHSSPNIISILVDAGADIHNDGAEKWTSSQKRGETPLHTASRVGRADNAVKLLELGANLEATSSAGYSPLSLATLLGDIKTIETLLDAGADKFVLNSFDETILHLSARSVNCLNVCPILIEAGLAVDQVDSEGNTALHAAARFGQGGMQILLNAGAEIDAKNDLGFTPLHLALTAFDIKAQQISVLIEAGADFSIKDNNDQTPLERAEKHNPKEYKEFKKKMKKTINDIIKKLQQN